MNNAFRVPLRASGGMPEYRQQTAGPEAGANVSARLDDSAARIIMAQANRNAQVDAESWEKFNRGLQTFLHSGNRLYNEYRDKTSRAYIQEAVQRSQEEFFAWKTEYDKTHQGEAGINAKNDYQREWNRISDAHLKGLRDKGVSGPYERYASLQFGENGLHYAQQGVAFQSHQDKIWKEGIADRDYVNFEQFVGMNPEAHEEIGIRMNQCLNSYALAHPGVDLTPYRMKLQKLAMTTSINSLLADQNYAGVKALMDQYASVMSPDVRAKAGSALDGAIINNLRSLIDAGRYDDAERLLQGVNAYVSAVNFPSFTGKARVLAKHESGTKGSMHVSYGLPQTDGVDVGKYSFITKGKGGGSVGDFIRWAGTQGGLGKQLYDKFYTLTGGNWNSLDSKDLWKNKGGQAAWQELVKSNPEAFEKLEDAFWLPRLEAGIAKLRPEVQAAIRNDKTGALYEMAISTINQHRTAIKILNDNFDPDPQKYIEKVYNDRAKPSRFAATGDPNIGVRRMREEVRDVLGIFNGGDQETPQYQLNTPQGTAELQEVIKGLDQKKQAAWAKSASDDIYSATAGLTGERRIAQGLYLAEQLTPDPELQQMIMKDVESRMKFDEVKRKASMIPQLDEAAQIIDAPGYTLPEKRLLIQQSPLPDEVKQIAFKEIDARINGDDNKAASAAGLTQLRALYDERRGNISEEEALSLAVDYGLNKKDRDTWLQYKGRADVYPQFRIQKLAESVDSSLKNNSAKVAELYDALMKRIPAGDATWDDKKIKAEIFNLLQAGKRPDAGWFGGGQTFGEAVRTGQTGTWRPTMDEATDKSYAVALENDHTPIADGFSASVGDVYTHASDDIKKLLRQQRYMRERFGVNISWTKEEQAMLAREVNKVQALKNKGAF